MEQEKINMEALKIAYKTSPTGTPLSELYKTAAEILKWCVVYVPTA